MNYSGQSGWPFIIVGGPDTLPLTSFIKAGALPT
jgi:hypothetical protein